MTTKPRTIEERAPERIWLQRCPDGSLDNHIWTQGDVEYIRADLPTTGLDQREGDLLRGWNQGLEAAISRVKELHDEWQSQADAKIMLGDLFPTDAMKAHAANQLLAALESLRDTQVD